MTETMGKNCSWLVEAQLSPTIKQQHTGMTLYKYIILPCILVPSGTFEVWSPKKIREHWQKSFIMLSEFFLLKWWGDEWGMGVDWVNPLKNIFSDNIEWSFTNFWKMISADVKANIKQQETKDLVAVSYKSFLDVYFSSWFWLIFPSLS